MSSSTGIEPVVGKKYRFSYVGGRSFDPDRVNEEGVFIQKYTTPPTGAGATRDLYIFARHLPGFRSPFPGNADIPDFYILTYISKNEIQEEKGNMNAGFDLDKLLTVVNSKDFVHPSLAGTLSPTKYLYKNDIENILRKEKARNNISSFMTHAIYHGPIRKTTNTGEETTVFSGGPMYKRGIASFTGSQRKSRKSRKQRGGDGMGQPLKYTDASHQEPSAPAGFNWQGVEAPYLMRPRLDAMPMRGGAEQILSPMSFQDAYHSPPHAPTGQSLTDLKLPATLRQGLNLGPLSGGGWRRKNTRRGGFYPSIMSGVVSNAPLLAPLAARQGVRLLEEYRRTTRRRRRSSRKTARRRNSGRRA